MRAASPTVNLSADQTLHAGAGTKTLIPIVGQKTLLDLIVFGLTKAGFSDVCLVIGPEHNAIRDHCSNAGLEVHFAVQQEPIGTADAVAAAEGFVGGDALFLVVNSDNLYPVGGLSKLREIGRPAMLAFERISLIEHSNIPEERIDKFAVVEVDGQGNLSSIIEKPDRVEPNALISMNAWLFSNRIFEACRMIEPSGRGELELTAAVQYAIDNFAEKIVAIETREGVLDLSSRADIESIRPFLNHL